MCEEPRHGLAVGFFDGVHRAHQAVLARASRVLTFRNHPLSILAPEKAPRLLMTTEDRLAAIRACGVTDILALDFTRDLSQLSPDDFISEFIQERTVYCGENWHFGRGGKGDGAYLRAKGIDVEMIPLVQFEGAPISSTRIRAAIQNAQIKTAADMLGRPWTLRGTIEKGKGLGHTIGYATLNIRPAADLITPPNGVYSVRLNGLKGIANFGLAPTMGARAWTAPELEVHLLEPTQNLPRLGENVKVAFYDFIRPEKKFDSLESLRAQIAADIARL